MDSTWLEVKSAVLHTYDGEAHEVHGGAYLSPEAYLTTRANLQKPIVPPTTVPLIVGAALLGIAAGYWLGRRSDEE